MFDDRSAILDPSVELADFLRSHPRLFVLTGAGISTGSGIPDYRDLDGGWKRRPPVTYQAFVADAGLLAAVRARIARLEAAPAGGAGAVASTPETFKSSSAA